MDEERLAQRMHQLDEELTPRQSFADHLRGVLEEQMNLAPLRQGERSITHVDAPRPSEAARVVPHRLRRPAIGLAVAASLFLALGSIALLRPLRSDQAAPEAGTSASLDAQTAPPPTVSVFPSLSVRVGSETLSHPLAEIVDGFQGTLVATVGRWGDVRIVDWPAHGRASESPFPEAYGPEISYDISGALIAFLGPGPDNMAPHGLYVGSYREPTLLWTGLDITFAWHASMARQLAWVGRDSVGDVASLYTADMRDPDSPIASSAPIVEAARLFVWDTEGFVVLDEANGHALLRRLRSDGTRLSEISGVEVVTRGPDGRLLLWDAQGSFFLADALLMSMEALDWAPTDVRAEYSGAAWSPDGAHIAFLHYSGDSPGRQPDRFLSWELQIWSNTGSIEHRIPLGRRVWDVTWGPESRFVAMPGSDNEFRMVVLLYDTINGQLYELQFNSTVRDVVLLD